VLSNDPLMADVGRSLATTLAELPVLTLLGRKNDPHGWQARFGQIFSGATAVAIPGGRHFPFNDDPDGYSATIRTWWANKVATAAGYPATS
jgi:pimeloyl-ACP methyl ester carboxylesterase